MKEKYTSILMLKDRLKKENIPFNFRELFGGYQICYPNKNNLICSVIEHSFSYGSENNLLEINGFVSEEVSKYDDVEGYLTVDDVFNRIKKHYDSINKGE